MTSEELATECERRLKMRTYAGMKHDAYIRAAVIVMFEVVSEAISAATAASLKEPGNDDVSKPKRRY